MLTLIVTWFLKSVLLLVFNAKNSELGLELGVSVIPEGGHVTKE